MRRGRVCLVVRLLGCGTLDFFVSLAFARKSRDDFFGMFPSRTKSTIRIAYELVIFFFFYPRRGIHSETIFGFIFKNKSNSPVRVGKVAFAFRSIFSSACTRPPIRRVSQLRVTRRPYKVIRTLTQ